MKIQLDQKKLLLLGLGVLLLLIIGVASCNKKKDKSEPEEGRNIVEGTVENTDADGDADSADAGDTTDESQDGADAEQDGASGADVDQDGSGEGQDGDADSADAGQDSTDESQDGDAQKDAEQEAFMEQLDAIPEGEAEQETTRRAAANSTQAGLNSIETADYSGALSFFNTALANGEKERPIYRGRGIAYMGLGQFDAAIEDFLHYLSLSNGKVTEEDYDVNYYLGTAYYKLGRYQEAADTYSAVLTMKPKEKQAYYLRGVTELTMGDDEAALADFDAILAMDEDDYDMRIAIYRAYANVGKAEQGTAYLTGVADQENTKISDYDRGRIYYYLGDYKNARTYLEKSKGSSGPDGILMLGRTYEQLEDYNYAASVYTNYLAENGANVEIYNQLAICRMEDEDYEGALSALERGLETASGGLRQAMLYNEAILYERLGRFSEASEVIAQYVAAYPDDEEAVKEYEFLKNR